MTKMARALNAARTNEPANDAINIVRALERTDIAGDMLVTITGLIQSEEIEIRVNKLLDDISSLDYVIRKPK